MSLLRTLATTGLSSGLAFAALMLGWDALEGSVPPWPGAAGRYAVLAVLFALGYGVLVWILRRRSTEAS